MGLVNLRNLAMLLALLVAAPVHAAAYADPQGSGVVVSAMGWLQGTLLGTLATTVAVIAIAAVGFMMLTGRMNWRHGAVVVIGCFILFGAASIVAGIRTAATGI
ncbi:TrbC/VirB2 family protein [Novosphingobium mangrovi (ex Huang et al. 2023)]|uniref:TrbC/VirB2 family protein n=1 Tax=Novosphingobium mangrovi (ex Huang et al. 2023) TaxID=2976432 RepID=A0ABT2IAJ1_9SPHN|nr:TrbC/VirB2 family protein [Novosphingobium mangrovi (ex Huang et al. 2023)]MCT2401851.1 TrbC/VirB2 family protein [Novosphingobium mangrovi (ex Huang et al. 2023)]